MIREIYKKEDEVGNDCVFLWIGCGNYPTYKNYSFVKNGPGVLVNLRHDGTFGTIGGKVDEGESLREALIRECKEESGLDFSDEAILELAKHVYINPKGKEYTIHSYYIITDIESLQYAFRKMNQNKSLESSGFNIVSLTEESMFLNNKFNATAKEELIKFLNKLTGAN